jgi:lysophospholipase L1-like esterase
MLRPSIIADILRAVLALLVGVAACAHAADNPHPPLTIACIGDSITDGSGAGPTGGYPYQLAGMLGPGCALTAYGKPGATALAVNQCYLSATQAAAVDAADPAVVMIMLGTNDCQAIYSHRYPHFVEDYTAIIAHFANLPGHPGILCVLPPPIVINPFRNDSTLVDTIIPGIRQAAAAAHVPVCDGYTPLVGLPQDYADGLHPNEAGCTILAGTISRALYDHGLAPIPPAATLAAPGAASAADPLVFTLSATVPVTLDPAQVKVTNAASVRITGPPWKIAVTPAKRAEVIVTIPPGALWDASGTVNVGRLTAQTYAAIPSGRTTVDTGGSTTSGSTTGSTTAGTTTSGTTTTGTTTTGTTTTGTASPGTTAGSTASGSTTTGTTSGTTSAGWGTTTTGGTIGTTTTTGSTTGTIQPDTTTESTTTGTTTTGGTAGSTTLTTTGGTAGSTATSTAGTTTDPLAPGTGCGIGSSLAALFALALRRRRART